MYNPVFHITMESFTTPNSLSWIIYLFWRQCSSAPNPCWCGVLSILSSESLPFPHLMLQNFPVSLEYFTQWSQLPWAHLLSILPFCLSLYYHPADLGGGKRREMYLLITWIQCMPFFYLFGIFFIFPCFLIQWPLLYHIIRFVKL